MILSILMKLIREVTGMLKNESNSKITTEIVGLRPKINNNLVDDENDSSTIFKKARCIRKSIARNYIMHKVFVAVLIGTEQMKHEINNTVGINHYINSLSVRKISLSPSDDKIYYFTHRSHSCKFHRSAWCFFRTAACSSHFLPFLKQKIKASWEPSIDNNIIPFRTSFTFCMLVILT